VRIKAAPREGSEEKAASEGEAAMVMRRQRARVKRRERARVRQRARVRRRHQG